MGTYEIQNKYNSDTNLIYYRHGAIVRARVGVIADRSNDFVSYSFFP